MSLDGTGAALYTQAKMVKRVLFIRRQIPLGQKELSKKTDPILC